MAMYEGARLYYYLGKVVVSIGWKTVVADTGNFSREITYSSTCVLCIRLANVLGTPNCRGWGPPVEAAATKRVGVWNTSAIDTGPRLFFFSGICLWGGALWDPNHLVKSWRRDFASVAGNSQYSSTSLGAAWHVSLVLSVH